ncbi:MULTISPECIES: hypothetical protein [Streptomyces]|uniref:hypothetical protein n=1 Tax=Streptomyces TaxID=1883 RepID=UPI0011B026F1|nr:MULTISPECIES: hypothetical protein [unclassified Streptomyces]
MTAKHRFPDMADKAALRAWMAARRTETPRKSPPRTLAEFRSLQLKKLARTLQGDSDLPELPQDRERPVLKFALDGKSVRNHRAEASVLGDWLHTLQTAVQSVAYALDDLRQRREAGPVPGEIKRATRLFSGPVFASSYGMVLQGAPNLGQAELPGSGTEVLLDKAINRLFDITDGASKESDAEEAILDAVLPLGRRAIKQLSDLSHILASSGTNVTLTWESKTTTHRTSTFTSASAARCRKALQDARIEDASERLTGLLVGGSKLRGFIELEVAGKGLIVVRTAKDDVTGILAVHTDKEVKADVHVLIARSPGGREHRSYVLIDLQGRRSVSPDS